MSRLITETLPEGYTPVAEDYMSLPSGKKKEHIDYLKERMDKLLDDQIANPMQGTDSKRWKWVKNKYKKNIKGLSIFEQYVQHQFAYTVNKGDTVKLCLCDKDGEVDRDLNFYVLIHETVHVYDSRFLTTANSHDGYFWTIFAKLIKRAIALGLLDGNIFDQNQKRCDTDILRKEDIDQIEVYAQRTLQPRE